MADKTDSLGKVPTSRQAGSSKKSEKSSAVEITEVIGLLAVNYPLPTMDAAQKKAWLLTYCHDLSAFSVQQIKGACERYRQNPGNKFMATSGALLAIIHSSRTEPRGHERRPTADGGHQPWGGACTCVKCTTALSRDGFYKAPGRENDRAEYDREQADQWFKSQIPPSKLDEAEMELRNRIINRLVMDEGMDREDARVRVMRERSAILYPDNAHANPTTATDKLKAEILARPSVVMTPELIARENFLAAERAEALGRPKA